MCLILRPINFAKPYNRSNIRWKIVQRLRCFPKGDFLYTSPFQFFSYDKEGWNTAQTRGLNPQNAGFHVFVTRREARESLELVGEGVGTNVVKRAEVRGFLRSGKWSDGCVRNETWAELRFAGKA